MKEKLNIKGELTGYMVKAWAEGFAYFKKSYDQRTKENKIFLHFYAIVIFILPIAWVLWDILHPKDDLRPFLTVGAFIGLYIYIFVAYNFPEERKDTLMLFATILISYVILFFTSGSQSIVKTIKHDAFLLLTTIIILSVFIIIYTISKKQKAKKIPLGIKLIPYALITTSLGVIASIIFLIIDTYHKGRADSILNIVGFSVALVSTIYTHGRFIRKHMNSIKI